MRLFYLSDETHETDHQTPVVCVSILHQGKPVSQNPSVQQNIVPVRCGSLRERYSNIVVRNVYTFSVLENEIGGLDQSKLPTEGLELVCIRMVGGGAVKFDL